MYAINRFVCLLPVLRVFVGHVLLEKIEELFCPEFKVFGIAFHSFSLRVLLIRKFLLSQSGLLLQTAPRSIYNIVEALYNIPRSGDTMFGQKLDCAFQRFKHGLRAVRTFPNVS